MLYTMNVQQTFIPSMVVIKVIISGEKLSKIFSQYGASCYPKTYPWILASQSKANSSILSYLSWACYCGNGNRSNERMLYNFKRLCHTIPMFNFTDVCISNHSSTVKFNSCKNELEIMQCHLSKELTLKNLQSMKLLGAFAQ